MNIEKINEQLHILKKNGLILATIGDYVLATKYSDKDPCDPWFVGFVSSISIYPNAIYYKIAGNNRDWKYVNIITAEQGKEWIERNK